MPILDKQYDLARAIVKAKAYSAECNLPVYVVESRGTFYIERGAGSEFVRTFETLHGHARAGIWSYTENRG